MKKIKLGLIGLGYIGKIHLRNSLRLTNAQLEAVSDLSKRALKNAKNSGVKKTFTSYDQLLKDPNIDAVIISLPTHLHKDCVKKAAEAKKHIFLEKPIAKDVTEAKEIFSASRKNGVTLMMGYPLRFNKIMNNLRSKINSGEIGDVVVAYATNVSTGPFMHRAIGHSPVPVPEWWFKKELTGGGALIDLGSHLINLLRWYFGEITSVKSHLDYRFNLDLEDQAICLVRFKTGTKAIINVGYFSQGYQLKVDLLGTMGNLTADNVIPNPIITAVKMLTTNTSDFWQPYYAELEHFVNCLINDTQPVSSGIDGLRDLEAIETAYKNSIDFS
jgi:predicted dehydrogenase